MLSVDSSGKPLRHTVSDDALAHQPTAKKEIGQAILKGAPLASANANVERTIATRSAHKLQDSTQDRPKPAQSVRRAQLETSYPTETALVKQLMTELPEDRENVDPRLLENPEVVVKILDAHRTEAPDLGTGKTGTRLFDKVLVDLNRLKNDLEGKDKEEPVIDIEDDSQLYFGRPKSMFKDYCRMKLREPSSPPEAFFWKLIAAFFGVYETNSRYEQIHEAIQRFGLLIENKARIHEILDSGDTSRYREMGQITGLGWHPDLNVDYGVGGEKGLIDVIEQFLTAHYEKAKAEGKLSYFFRSIDGVCLEAWAQSMSKYIERNLVALVTEKSVKDTYNDELMRLGMMNNGKLPKPQELRNELAKMNVFETEFKEEGGRAKPTLAHFHEYALTNSSSDFMAMKPYTYDEFLETELEIYRTAVAEAKAKEAEAEAKKKTEKGDKPVTKKPEDEKAAAEAVKASLYKEGFIKQLQTRLETMRKKSLTIDLEGDVQFDIGSQKTKDFIDRAIQQGRLVQVKT